MDDERLALAQVALVRYSIELTALAAGTLGSSNTSNMDIGVLLAVHRSPGTTPATLAARLGISRSSVSRSLRRLREEGLVGGTGDPADRRTVRLGLTSDGVSRIATFESRLAEHFVTSRATVLDIVAALGSPEGPEPADGSLTPLAVAERLAVAGEGFRAEASLLLGRVGVVAVTDRYALALLHPFGPTRPGRLAEELRLTSGGVTQLLHRLERLGLVERAPLPDGAPQGGTDRRGVLVMLTPEGSRLAVALLDVLRRHGPKLAGGLLLTLGAWHGRGVA